MTLEKLDLNVTNRCNLRCRHCCFDSGNTRMDELGFEDLQKVLRDAKEAGAWRFDMTGGEALLRKDAFDIIKYGKERGYRIELLSNGLLLSQNTVDRLKEIGLDAVGISLDGSSAEKHLAIRHGCPSYETIIDNISRCVSAGFYTKINTVVFSTNLMDIAAITELAISLGCDEHGVYFFSPVGRGSKNMDLAVNPKAWLGYVRNRMTSYRDWIKLSLETPYIETARNPRKNVDCYIHDPVHLQILPDGNVYPCAIMASYGLPLANLNESILSDIWNDKELWRHYAEEADKILAAHHGCVDYSRCFDMDYDNFTFVCPCKKLDLEDLE